MSRPVATGRRYAEAAFQVALAEDQLDRWQADLRLAAGLLGSPEVVPVVAGAPRSVDMVLGRAPGSITGTVTSSSTEVGRESFPSPG